MYYFRIMKIYFLLISFVFTSLNAQISIKENTSMYSGYSNFIFENSKSSNGFFYNIVLFDSVKIADTVFKSTSLDYSTLMVSTTLNGALKWHLTLKGFYSEKPFRIQNSIKQIVNFTDSVYNVRNLSLNNPNKERTIAIVSIDTLGNNLSMLKIGNEIKSDSNSRLRLNCISVNTTGNIVVSGYQNGQTVIGNQLFQSDSIVSTYFIAEINSNGVLVNYKKLFNTESVYSLTRGIEYGDKMIFETGFDSLVVGSKGYTSAFIAGQKIKDIALFAINKNTMDIVNYLVVQDSSDNPNGIGTGIICNSNGIVWSIKSGVRTIKLNDSFINIDPDYTIIHFFLDVNTVEYKKYFFVNSEETLYPIDIDVFDAENFIITFRSPGKYVQVNEEKLSVPTGNSMHAFVVFNPANKAKLILSISGDLFIAQLTKFNESSMDLWIRYLFATSYVEVKSETLERHLDQNNWPYQYSHYTFNNFSSINEVSTNSFILYPNPTDDILKIQFKNGIDQQSANYQINITNILGKKYRSEILSSEALYAGISVVDLPSGVYCITIINDYGFGQTYKFVKS